MRRRAAFLLIFSAVLVACGGGGDDGAADEGKGTTTSSPERTTSTSTSPSTEPAPPTVPSPTGLVAGIEESRLFAIKRQLALQLEVPGATGVPITTVRLASPLFEPVEPMPRQVTIQAGFPAVSMPLSYGAARCLPPETGTGSGPSMVEVTVAGVVEPLPLDPTSVATLQEVHDEECAVRRVNDAVEIRFGDRWEPAGENVVAGQLILRGRRADVAATLEELRGSVVFTILPDVEAPYAEIDGDTAEAQVNVEIKAARCDPHALTESARKYIFQAYLSVDGEAPQPVDFEAQGNARTTLASMLAECVDAVGGG